MFYFLDSLEYRFSVFSRFDELRQPLHHGVMASDVPFAQLRGNVPLDIVQMGPVIGPQHLAFDGCPQPQRQVENRVYPRAGRLVRQPVSFVSRLVSARDVAVGARNGQRFHLLLRPGNHLSDFLAAGVAIPVDGHAVRHRVCGPFGVGTVGTR